MSKIICMSDIHGCFDVFERRLEQLGGLHSVLHGSDQLILLGDYINYGPESGKVLRRIFSLQQSCPERVIVLRGNHEDALAGWLRQHFGQRSADDAWYNNWLADKMHVQTIRGLVTEEQWAQLLELKGRVAADELEHHVAQMLWSRDRKLFQWLLKLPYFHKTQTQIFVHAGVDEEAEDWWELGTPDYYFTQKFPPTTGRFYRDIIAGHVGTAGLAKDQAFHDVFWDGDSHYFCDGTTAKSGKLPVLVYDTERKQYFSLGKDEPAPPDGWSKADCRRIRGELRPLFGGKAGTR